MKKSLIILSSIFSVIFIQYSILSDGEEESSNIRSIGVISDQNPGDISACWNPHSNEFIIVGGQDLFGKDDPVHNRYIYSSNGYELKSIVKHDEPGFGEYQRFVDVSVHPNENYALITQLHSGVWKLESEMLTQVYSDPETPFWAVTWEPNGEYAIFGTWDRLFRYDNDGTVTEIETEGHGCTDYSWHPDGDYVLLGDSDYGEIGWYDGSEFKLLEIPSAESQIVDIAFSPTEEKAIILSSTYYCGCGRDLYTFNGEKIIKIEYETDISLENSSLEIGNPTWMNNGEYVFFTSYWINDKNILVKYDIIENKMYNIYYSDDIGNLLGIQPNGDYLLFATTYYDEEMHTYRVELLRWDIENDNKQDSDLGFNMLPMIPIAMIILIIISNSFNRKKVII